MPRGGKRGNSGGRPRKHYLQATSQNRATRDHMAWSLAVKRRDGFKCQWPNCNCRTKLQSHHVMRHANYPTLRHVVSNGITLCKEHHKLVNGKEEAYAPLFLTIIQQKMQNDNRKDI